MDETKAASGVCSADLTAECADYRKALTDHAAAVIAASYRMMENPHPTNETQGKAFQPGCCPSCGLPLQTCSADLPATCRTERQSQPQPPQLHAPTRQDARSTPADTRTARACWQRLLRIVFRSYYDALEWRIMRSGKSRDARRDQSVPAACPLGRGESQLAHGDSGTRIRYGVVLKAVRVLDASGRSATRHVLASSPIRELRQGDYPVERMYHTGFRLACLPFSLLLRSFWRRASSCLWGLLSFRRAHSRSNRHLGR